MKPFSELTHLGKIGRIRNLALQALEHYDLNVQKVTFVSDWTNTIFRVYTSNNTSYMLRVCRPDWRTDEDLHSEMMWLQDLHHNSDIGAPEPIPTRKGDTVITLSNDGVPKKSTPFKLASFSGASITLPKENVQAHLMDGLEKWRSS